MGKRSTSRRLAMQALFQAEHAKEDISRALEDVFEENDYIPETKKFAKYLAQKTFKQTEELDQIISEFSRDWPVDRLSGVDRAVLRLVLCELRLNESPQKVIIDEALNLAHKYSDLRSVKFINGIIGAYLKKPSISEKPKQAQDE